MKKCIFIIVYVLMCNLSYSQTLIDSAMSYQMPTLPYNEARAAKISALQAVAPFDTSEGGYINEFGRKSAFNEDLRCTNAPNGADMFAAYRQVMRGYMTGTNSFCDAGSGNWKCVGPFNNCYGTFENQGRADILWVDPNDTSHLLVGTFGGLWRSRNAGLSWHNITDNVASGYSGDRIPGTMGVIAMDVNPLDTTLIYLFLSEWGGIGFGAAYSIDGGVCSQTKVD